MKRVLSVLLIVILLAWVCPVSVVADLPTQIEIWRGNDSVVINKSKRDVFGDGTVSYNSTSNTLTLNGASLNVLIVRGSINIVLTESENEVVDIDGLSTSAIHVFGDLNISGNGKLTAVGCNKYTSSHGIYADGSVVIDGSEIIAKGGDVLLPGSDVYAYSRGVFVTGSFTIKSGGKLIATGGKTAGNTADSCGLSVIGRNDGAINIYDGILYAEGGIAEGAVQTFSDGMTCGGNINVFEVASSVTAKGGYGISTSSSSVIVRGCGISILGGDLNIYGGNVDIYTEGTEENEDYTHGVEVGISSTYDKITGEIVDYGGSINITCDNPEDININITGKYGSALLAGEKIYINKLLTISEPVDAEVKIHAFDSINGPYDAYSIVNKYGKIVNSMSIGAADDVDYIIGDVNDDGHINAEDALMVLKHSAKLVTLKGYGKIVADIEYDEKIDAEDALKILKKAARIDDWFER